MIENSQLLEYIGETKSQKLIRSITKEYHENFRKQYPKYNEIMKACSLVSITKDKEIKSIGMSCMSDLLTDNFGKTLAGIFFGSTPYTLKNTGNGDTVITFRGSSQLFNNPDSPAIALGTQIQVGKGTTPATRQDFNIEDPFVSSPESTPKNTGVGGWNSGLGEVLASMIPFGAGSSGAISETCFFWHMRSAGTKQIILESRDNISPVVNFIGGETINVSYGFGFT